MLRLQLVALFQQRAIARCEPAQQRGEATPERLRIAAQRGEHFVLDESCKLRVGIDPGAGHVFGH